MWVGFVFFAVGGALEDGKGVFGGLEEGNFCLFPYAFLAVVEGGLIDILLEDFFGCFTGGVFNGGVCAVFQEKADGSRIRGEEKGSAAVMVSQVGVCACIEKKGDRLCISVVVERGMPLCILGVWICAVFQEKADGDSIV